MSTIKITFATQALDFANPVRGKVDIHFNDGARDYILTSRLRQGVSVSTYFSEVTWNGNQDVNDNQQAANFATAFNRDYASVGSIGTGLRPTNMEATVIDNEVTITALNGTFLDGQSNYTGSVLVVGGFVVDNSIQVPELLLSTVISTTVGDCDAISYALSASGGTGPYTLTKEGVVIDSNWDGSVLNSDFTRGLLINVTVSDTSGQSVSRTIISPRKLKEGEFKLSELQFDGYSDLTIQEVNPVSGTTPLQYSVEPEGSTIAINYQQSNSFPGVAPGKYVLFVKDRYDCEVSKTIEVRELEDATTSENPRYFEVMRGNSIIFSECVTYDQNTKKNVFNTRSTTELAELNHTIIQEFDTTDFERIQFKSSYPYHIITLNDFNGTKIDIAPKMIQENLGAKEKVDCKLFPVDGKMGVYFNGGNQYEAGTDTVIGNSPYQPNQFDNRTFLPDWAEVGQLVFLDTLGGFNIESTGFDDVRGGYFVVDSQISSEADSKVQVTHNIQIYNVFECYVRISDISDKAQIVFEKGFNFNQIDGNKWVSEIIKKINDTPRHLLIKYGSDQNQAGIVFLSNMICTIRKVGKFRPIWDGEAETEKQDSKSSSLRQASYIGFRLEFEAISSKQVDQLNIATGLNYFTVNGLELVRTEYPEATELEESNLYDWVCEFDYGGDNLSISDSGLVLDISTGKEGGGGTGKEGDAFPEIHPIAVNGKILAVNGKIITR